jgi:glycosyltransferase involved in cell wall biosynthesis
MVNINTHFLSGTASNGKRQDKRIVHVPRRFVAHEWGGTETVVLEMAKQQRAAGFDPVIVTSMALTHVAHDTIEGIPVERHPHAYPFLGLSNADIEDLDKKGGNLLSLRLFKGLLKQPNVRLYHAHTLKRLGGMVRTAARINDKPYVVTLHGGVFDVPEEERESLVKPIRGKFEWGRPFGALFGSRRVLEDAHMVICVGESERVKAAQQLDHDRIMTIPNGVDAQRFSKGDGAAFRAKFGIPADAFVILNVARIDPQKNQMLLLDAFRQVHVSRPNTHLVLVGPVTSTSYAIELRSFIQSYGLESAVTLIPGLGANAVVNAYHAGDVFVLPSRHEPFGIAALEAWSAGLPVVASCVGGLSTLIKHGINGLSIFPNEPQAYLGLAAAIEVLASEPSQRRLLGDAGRAEARTKYSWQAIHQQVETAYEQAEEFARIGSGK